MDDYDEMQESVARIADSIRVQLREEYRYIKTAPLNAIISRCKAEMMLGILVQQPVMAASKNRMSLMTLPKNVRNQIYWLVMKPDADDEEDQEKYRWVDGTPVLILQSEGTDKYGADYCNDTKWWLQPAITKVSRKVRKEALPVYYGNIEFQIHGTGYIDQLDAAGESLSHIGKNARWIRHLRVFYQYDDMEDNLKQETLDFLKPIPASSIAMKMRRAPMSVLGRLGAELAGDLGEEYDDM